MSEPDTTPAARAEAGANPARGFLIFLVVLAFVIVIIASTMGGRGDSSRAGSSTSTHTMSDGTKMNGGGMDMGSDSGR